MDARKSAWLATRWGRFEGVADPGTVWGAHSGMWWGARLWMRGKALGWQRGGGGLRGSRILGQFGEHIQVCGGAWKRCRGDARDAVGMQGSLHVWLAWAALIWILGQFGEHAQVNKLWGWLL